MSIVKNETDKLPEHLVDDRAKTYQGLMKAGYVWGLPLAIAVVMFFTMLLLKAGLLAGLVVGFLTWLAVLGFSKTFFVH